MSAQESLTTTNSNILDLSAIPPHPTDPPIPRLLIEPPTVQKGKLIQVMDTENRISYSFTRLPNDYYK